MSDTAAVSSIERYSRVLRTCSVSFRGDKASAAGSDVSEGQAVRLIDGGRLGVASRLGAASSESDSRVLERAREAAAAGDAPGFSLAGGTPALVTAEELGAFHQATADLAPAQLKEMGDQALELIRASAPDVVTDIDLRVRSRHDTLVLADGVRQEQQASVFSASVMLSLPLDQDLVNVEGEVCARNAEGVVAAAVSRALGWLAPARKRVRINGGYHRVVFAPEAVAALIDPLVLALDGLEAAVGSSPWASSLGDDVLDARLSLVDDGVAVDGVAASLWDGEGVARRRHDLVVRGELRSYYHDLRSAARLGVSSTGNAVRNDLLPRLAPGNWRIGMEGAVSLAELYRDAGDALLVVGLLGVGQTAARDGSFANPVALGFQVSGGEIVGRVTDVTIAGNAFDLLRECLMAAGDDGRWSTAPGFPLHTPTLLLDRVAVTAG